MSVGSGGARSWPMQCHYCGQWYTLTNYMARDGGQDSEGHYLSDTHLIGCHRRLVLKPEKQIPERKTCRVCGIEKPADQFQKDRKSVDGLERRCKACKHAIVITSRTPQTREQERQSREQRIAEDNAMGRVWAKKNREKVKAYAAKSYQLNKEKHRARRQLTQAVKRGAIVPKLFCEDCGRNGKLEAHHEDYCKPLDVVWICSSCHGKRHRRVHV